MTAMNISEVMTNSRLETIGLRNIRNLNMTSTACWRGYIATWEVRNESLLLKSLGKENFPNDDEIPIPLQKVFPDSNGPILADWFFRFT